MTNLLKTTVIAVFTAAAIIAGLGSANLSEFRPIASAQAKPSPTAAPVNANTSGKSATNEQTMRRDFVLGKDSLSEYGEVAFNHETHAFKLYSPDGKSVVGCAECHHTDQPKSALKAPLVTSERDVVLTHDSWKASSQKVNECRFCHFQDGGVPDGKTMPVASYTEGAKSVKKDLNNELAYHINCNTCHDVAAKLRPELKKKPGFATTKDCLLCHKSN